MKATLLTLATMLGLGAIGTAQTVSFHETPEYRAYQIERLLADRDLLLAMVDAMPDDKFRLPLTGGMHGAAGHDFAMHVSGLIRQFNAALGRASGVAPAEIETAGTTLETRADLKANIRAVYDHAADVLRDQPPAQRNQFIPWGSAEIPGWQFWDAYHDMNAWNFAHLTAFFTAHGLRYPQPRGF